MTDTAVAVTTTEERYAEIAAQVVVKGDLSKLTEAEKTQYYTALCRSLGFNPLTRPFEFITLNGKLTLYAKRDAADQLRRNAGVTITSLTKEAVGDLLVVTAYGRTPDGREDASTGAVSVRGLSGEALANAMMKAETKAKRRLALSLVGLGFPTEDEVEDIPAEPVETPRASLADRVAERAAAIAAVAPVEVVAEAETVEGEILSDDSASPAPLTDAEVAESLDADADAEAAVSFKRAADALGLTHAQVAAAGRKAYPGVAFPRAYTAAHWQGLAAELGLDMP